MTASDNWAQYTCSSFKGNIAPGELVRAPVGTVAIYLLDGLGNNVKAQRAVAGAAMAAGGNIQQEIIQGIDKANEIRSFLQVTVLSPGKEFKHKTMAPITAPSSEDV